ncbi:MAG: hemerythrin family protein [Planctomycetaceae bacterium]|nr:hemerythrin family protein [Planctomycetaceae bacterium]
MLWQPTFQCNIPHIDAQHMALFDYIGKLGSKHGDISRIPETIDFLETYVKEHFADEESLHHQSRYPRALEHQRQHQAFINVVANLKKDYFVSGHNLSTLMQMNHAMVVWLKDHILNADKAYAAFFHDLPAAKRQTLRLPHRPWIPESSQSFYEWVTGIRQKDGPAKTNTTIMGKATLRSGGQTTRVFGSSWTDAMLCGIPAIDEQHKELFRQIDILREGGNRERIPNVLRFLADYVVKHFNDEESLHLKSRYPQAAPHRKLHEEFVKTFLELKAKYDKSGGDFSTVMELNKVVFDWLKNHVMKVDMQFAKYYLALNKEEA